MRAPGIPNPSPKNITRYATWAATALIAATLCALFIERHVARNALVALLVLGLLFLALPKLRPLTRHEKIFVGLALSVYVYVLLNIVGHGAFEYLMVKLRLYEKYLIPLLLISILRRLTVPASAIWWFVCFAACVNGLVAAKAYIDGIERYLGFGQAIPLGDLALLSAVLAAISWPYFRARGKMWLPLVSILCAAWATVYSQTRGALIAVPGLGVLILWYFRNEWHWKSVAIGLGFFAIVALALWYIPSAKLQDQIQARIENAFSETKLYFADDGSQLTSVSVRFELWKAAWMGFKENPIFGIGYGEFNEWNKQLIQQGAVQPYIAPYKHAHNEYMEQLAAGGLVGFTVFAALLVWLARYFYRAAKIADDETRLFGLAGLVVIVSYLHFCLTEAFFSEHLGAGFFAIIVSLLVHQIETRAVNDSNSVA